MKYSSVILFVFAFLAQGMRAVEESGASKTSQPIVRKPLLELGTASPDFVAVKPDGSEMKLSDLRGKVVILDFWATWCAPCRHVMPFVEEAYDKIRDQGVTVLGVCVWDERAAFDKWIVENDKKLSFTKVFDPAGMDTNDPNNRNTKSIAKRLYNVTTIPTLYVIGRDGAVVGGIAGLKSATDPRLVAALQKAGIRF